jgi:hypothetical protein
MGVEMPGEETTVHEDADQNEGIEAAGEERSTPTPEEEPEEEAAPKVDVWQEKAPSSRLPTARSIASSRPPRQPAAKRSPRESR